MLNSNTTNALLFLAGIGIAGPGCISHIKTCETRTEIMTEKLGKDCDEMRDTEAKLHCKELQNKIRVNAMSACMTIVSEIPMTCTEPKEDEFECKEVK